jgi:hypothetical protein
VPAAAEAGPSHHAGFATFFVETPKKGRLCEDQSLCHTYSTAAWCQEKIRTEGVPPASRQCQIERAPHLAQAPPPLLPPPLPPAGGPP